MSAVELLQSQVTQPEAFAALKSWILSAPSPPPEVVLDTAGTPENAFLWALSVAEEARSEDRARYALAAFRSTAPVEWLRLHAPEFFGLGVQFAGYATTNVTATNASGNAYPSTGVYEPGELRVVNDGTKAIYENTVQVAIPPAQISPFVAATVTFPVRAIDAGTGSNAGIGDINRLESALEGVTVTNPQAAQTVDDESAESINRRIGARIGLFGVLGAGSLSSGGPDTAVESIALSGRDSGGGCLRVDGTRVQVTRTKLVRDDATGISTLYVGDDDGPIDVGDLATVGDEVTWYAERVCSRVDTANVVLNTTTIEWAMTIRQSKLTDAEIEALVEAGLPAAALAVPVGGFDLSPDDGVPIEYIEGAIRGALAGKCQIVTIAVTLPASFVVFAPNEVAAFVLSATPPTITRIP